LSRWKTKSAGLGTTAGVAAVQAATSPSTWMNRPSRPCIVISGQRTESYSTDQYIRPPAT
jgi:hypothetical protein